MHTCIQYKYTIHDALHTHSSVRTLILAVTRLRLIFYCKWKVLGEWIHTLHNCKLLNIISTSVKLEINQLLLIIIIHQYILSTYYTLIYHKCSIGLLNYNYDQSKSTGQLQVSILSVMYALAQEDHTVAINLLRETQFMITMNSLIATCYEKKLCLALNLMLTLIHIKKN